MLMHVDYTPFQAIPGNLRSDALSASYDLFKQYLHICPLLE